MDRLKYIQNKVSGGKHTIGYSDVYCKVVQLKYTLLLIDVAPIYLSKKRMINKNITKQNISP